MTKVETLKVGDILHDVHSVNAGNSNMLREGHWIARVTEVGVRDGVPYAMISWNGTRPRIHYNTTNYKKWPKEWIRGDPGSCGLSGRWCAICRGREDHGGHKEDCEHPRAVAARKRATKAQKEVGG